MAFLRKRGRIWYGIWWEGKGKNRRQVGKPFSPNKIEADRKLDEQNEISQARRYHHKTINISWATFSQEYLNLTFARKRAASRDRDERTIKHFRNIMPTYTMAELSPHVLESYIAKRKAMGVKDSTINRDLNTLKHMTSCARQWGYLATDPWVDVAKFSIPEGDPKFFTHKEKKEIYDFCADSYERTVHNLGTLQGLRPGEMANLKWDEVKAGILGITSLSGDRTNPKKRVRIMQLHPQTRADLRDLKKEASCEYVLGLHGEQKTSRYICVLYKRILERCGLTGSLYSTRHTFGTTLAGRNIHQRTIQELMGHSKITTTQIYMHPIEKSKKDAIRRLPAHS